MNQVGDDRLFAPGVVEAVLARPVPVIAAALAGTALALGITIALMPVTYSARAVATITDPAQATFQDRGALTADYERYLSSVADFANSTEVLEEVAVELDLPIGVLDDATSISENVERRSVTFSSTADVPTDAALWANTLSEVFERRHGEHRLELAQRTLDALDVEILQADRDVEQAHQTLTSTPDDIAAQTLLDEAIARRNSLRDTRTEEVVNTTVYGSGVESMEPAEVPGEPSSPNKRLNAAMGLLLGTLAGVGFVWWRADRSRVFSSSEEPRNLIDTPMLGRVRRIDDDDPSLTTPAEMPGHDYQFVASALRATVERGVVLVGGSGSGIGTTVTTANLAVAALHDELTVVAIDLSENQQLSQLFGRDTLHSGLLDLLASRDGRVSRQRLTWSLPPVPVGDRSLRLMSLGTTERHAAANKLRSRQVRAVMAELRERFDLVFVDCGSVLDSAVAGAMAKVADGMVLVIQHGTASDLVIDARERLAVERVPVTGYVYSKASTSERRRFRSAQMDATASMPSWMNGAKDEPGELTAGRPIGELSAGPVVSMPDSS